MIAPRYRRPPTSLSPDEVASLVRMRETGATWKEIGRQFRKQDGACKTLFDRAKAENFSVKAHEVERRHGALA